MGDFSLIKIDGKPLEKFIDVVSKGVGTIYKPRAIRKEADAEAYKIEIVERAKSKAVAEGKYIDADTYDRIQERILHKETKRQHNIDNVTQVAAEQLSQESSVSDDPVDEDWTTRFFNIVEDVSDAEMQNIWARILAGEVKQPMSYSLRTLELIRNFSKKDAATFTKVANYAIETGGISFVFKGHNNELSKICNINFSDIAKLIEIGLIQPGSFINYELHQTENDYSTPFSFGETVVVVTKKANSGKISIPINLFTSSGNELLKLITPNPTFDYISSFAKSLKKENAVAQHGTITGRTGSYIHHTTPLLDFLE